MRKLIFTLLTSAILAGCASGLTGSSPAEKRADLTSVCVREQRTSLNFTPKEIAGLIEKSLAKKGIKTVTYEGVKIPENCKYVLVSALKGNKELIVRGHLVLRERSDETLNTIGEISYRYRGDEKAIAKQVGIQGQFDKMIAELFKNY
ncbi:MULTISPECIES: hypothetical protein [Rodentibacter]|uniref:Lipoprotein n=1 Tax=Rodentibacter haemolyticus TaxID=2778911 RepID=A0ABX6UZH3_9PAST|nr:MULTISPECIES: hypothetical protein [Rodentibacter]QPB43502.1 hypothetical protein IHV77_05320 [Rodentibacter haemolyticus]GJI56063.1 hypothetical protein HEMROJRC1_11750 [Rodentibacter sp. JRC1]